MENMNLSQKKGFLGILIFESLHSTVIGFWLLSGGNIDLFIIFIFLIFRLRSWNSKWMNWSSEPKKKVNKRWMDISSDTFGNKGHCRSGLACLKHQAWQINIKFIYINCIRLFCIKNTKLIIFKTHFVTNSLNIFWNLFC